MVLLSYQSLCVSVTVSQNEIFCLVVVVWSLVGYMGLVCSVSVFSLESECGVC